MMNNKKFKAGDRVKCSMFLYSMDSEYKVRIGMFVRYNKYGDEISYVDFGRDSRDISCFTDGIELTSKPNEQLLFEFMKE